MPVITKIKDIHDDMIEWRHHLHKYPETAFEETETSKFVADKLISFGLEVNRGLTETGVVATLEAGNGDKKIALRADMDALEIIEENDLSYKSNNEGKMHACGHDGHTAMLLGAAKYLSESNSIKGTVYFIFQPAEEVKAGAKFMIKEGLFEKFPTDCIFGLHNMPGLPTGEIAIKSGAIMASQDTFEIIVKGKGGHAAMPDQVNDPFIGCSNIISSLQTIVSRNINPLDSAVVSITSINGGNSWNIIPESVTIKGTFRCFSPEVRSILQERITTIVQSVCDALRLSSDINFNPENPGYPVTINTYEESNLAIKAAKKTVGEENLNTKPTPSMGAEDFSYMLQKAPGCYLWIGNGSTDNGCTLHNPKYDFNDEILPIGASLWVELVEQFLK